MPVLRSLLWVAAKQLASDPRVRRMAVEAAIRARPKVEEAARQIRAAAREASPLNEPAAFARAVRDRVIRRAPPR